MMPKIIFNGKEYDSPEAMPPEVRQLYQMAAGLLADRDQNGVPDIFEGGEAAPATVVQSTQFIVDGKTYTSLDELPAEARQKYEQALARLDANRDGVPDLFAGQALGVAAQSPATPAASPDHQPPQVQVIGDTSPLNARWLIIAFAVLALLAVAAFVLLSR
jgi:hypothetical protein